MNSHYCRVYIRNQSNEGYEGILEAMVGNFMAQFEQTGERLDPSTLSLTYELDENLQVPTWTIRGEGHQ